MTAETIVHVGSYRPDSPNGVDRCLAGLAQHSAADGRAVEVWHFRAAVDKPHSYVDRGVLVTELPFRKPLHRVPTLGGFLRLPPTITRDWVSSRIADVRLFHFHSVFQPENVWLAGKGRKYVITPNGGYGPMVLQGRNRRLKQLAFASFESRYVGRAAFLHAVSAAEEADLKATFPEQLVRVHPNGVEEEVFQHQYSPPAEGDVWLFLGRLAIDHKGLDLMLEAYAQAGGADGTLPPLVLAGPDFRDGQSSLLNMARARGIASRVSFTGTLDRQSRLHYLSRTRLFLHTSRWEGLPLSVLEALAAGRPVLATPGTNLQDIILAENAGYAANLSVSSIADAMRRAAAASQDDVALMSAAARQIAVLNYSWPAIARNLLRSYQKSGL